MNKVILIGRLTKNPDIRYTQGDNSMCIARYTIAVDRWGKDKEADFINCVAFGKDAEFAERYLTKGLKIAVTGRITTGSYTKQDGTKAYTTDVTVESQEFVESRLKAPEPSPEPVKQNTNEGWMELPLEAEGLPWN